MTDIYFLFGRFHFRTAIASKPFFPPTFLACTWFSFFFFYFSFFLLLKCFVQWAAFCRRKELWQIVRDYFSERVHFIEEKGTRWALLYNDTADCIFPQFCYSSYVKKIRSFLIFDIVVFQWAMSLSSVRIVARITGGFTSCLPLGRLVGHLWDSWHFLSAGQTDT